MARGANPRHGQSMKPLPTAKPGGVEATNPKPKNPKGRHQNQDEVPRGGGGIKGYEGQISRDR
jgi:hypothetical protein